MNRFVIRQLKKTHTGRGSHASSSVLSIRTSEDLVDAQQYAEDLLQDQTIKPNTFSAASSDKMSKKSQECQERARLGYVSVPGLYSMPGSHPNLGPQWNHGITSASLHDMRTSYSVSVDSMESSEEFLFLNPMEALQISCARMLIQRTCGARPKAILPSENGGKVEAYVVALLLT